MQYVSSSILALILLVTACKAEQPKMPGDDTEVDGYVNEAHAIQSGKWATSGTAELIQSGKVMKLTGQKGGEKGSIWTKAPIAPLDWEVRFWIRVEGDQDKPAKGMAFWYTNAPEKAGILYGSNEKFNGLGLLFDSFDDDHASDNPIIMTWMNNGTKLFHHDTDGLGTRFGGCRAKYRNRKAPVGVLVQYKASELTLKVLLHMGGKAGWEPCVAKDELELKAGGYLGFSAANKKDAVGDTHTVEAFKMWDLKKQTDEEKLKEDTEQKAQAENDKKPGVETHELVEAVKLKGKALQDHLVENLANQVKRDREFKVKEFGTVHTQLNEAIEKSVLGPNKQSLTDLSQSIEALHKASGELQIQAASTGSSLKANTGEQHPNEDLHNAEVLGHEMEHLLSSLQEQKRDFESEVHPFFRNDPDLGSSSTFSYLWVGIMVLQTLLIVGLFAFRGPKKTSAGFTGSIGNDVTGGYGSGGFDGGGFGGMGVDMQPRSGHTFNM